MELPGHPALCRVALCGGLSGLRFYPLKQTSCSPGAFCPDLLLSLDITSHILSLKLFIPVELCLGSRLSTSNSSFKIIMKYIFTFLPSCLLLNVTSVATETRLYLRMYFSKLLTKFLPRGCVQAPRQNRWLHVSCCKGFCFVLSLLCSLSLLLCRRQLKQNIRKGD